MVIPIYGRKAGGVLKEKIKEMLPTTLISMNPNLPHNEKLKTTLSCCAVARNMAGRAEDDLSWKNINIPSSFACWLWHALTLLIHYIRTGPRWWLAHFRHQSLVKESAHWVGVGKPEGGGLNLPLTVGPWTGHWVPFCSLIKCERWARTISKIQWFPILLCFRWSEVTDPIFSKYSSFPSKQYIVYPWERRKNRSLI